MAVFVPDLKSRTLFQCETCLSFFQDMEVFKQHPCSLDVSCSDSQAGTSGVNMVAEKGANWNESQTLLLIDCYKEYVSLVRSGKMKKKTLWENICSKFQEMGYGFSSEQICGRWKSLIGAYKNTKDSNMKSGSSRKGFEYENQLDELFAKDPTIEPECTLSSNSTVVSKRPASGESDKYDESSSSGTPEPAKKKASRSNASEMVSLFKTYLDEQKERDKEERERREQMHTERLQAMNSLIAAISSNRTSNANNNSYHHSSGRREWDPKN